MISRKRLPISTELVKLKLQILKSTLKTDCADDTDVVSSVAVESGDDSSAKEEGATMSTATEKNSQDAEVYEAVSSAVPSGNELAKRQKMVQQKRAEIYKSKFIAKYGTDLYEEIFKEFSQFKIDFYKMAWDMESAPVSLDLAKVLDLITQIPSFKVMCEIDRNLRATENHENGLEDFLHFAVTRREEVALILFIYTVHKVPVGSENLPICFFGKPSEFLHVLDAEHAKVESIGLDMSSLPIFHDGTE